MIYYLLNDSSKNFVNASGTASAIDSFVQTTYIRPGEAGLEVEGATGRVYPRFIEMRTFGDASTWEITMDTADGPLDTPKKTQVLNMTFTAGDSLRRYPVPAMTPGNYMRFKFRNSEAGVSSRILAARCYFKVQPFEGQRTS